MLSSVLALALNSNVGSKSGGFLPDVKIQSLATSFWKGYEQYNSKQDLLGLINWWNTYKMPLIYKETFVYFVIITTTIFNVIMNRVSILWSNQWQIIVFHLIHWSHFAYIILLIHITYVCIHMRHHFTSTIWICP